MPRHLTADVPARREPPSAAGRLSAHLPGFRRRLEEQRDFRKQQLADIGRRDPSDSGGQQRSVAALVAASAGQALRDIEGALLRMDIGGYGLCTMCRDEIPLQLLEAIPQTARCLSCHGEQERT